MPPPPQNSERREAASRPLKRRMSKTVKIILCVVFALIALSVAAYPLISNVINEKNKSLVETNYEATIADLDEHEINAAREAAITYNKKLFESPYNSFSKEALTEAEEGYEELLNIQGNGLMGYIEIPKISVDLPIYHGTEEDILNVGVGHLLGSSLPVGGESTHVVLTGHSGLSGKKLLSDLDMLAAGDVFYLHVMNETLAYQVDSIATVLPEDISLLRIDEGKDSCTLVTCTPFGVNSHRLLVRGERIPYEEAAVIEEQTEAETGVGSTWIQMYARGVLIGLAAILLLLGIYFLLKKLQKKGAAARG